MRHSLLASVLVLSVFSTAHAKRIFSSGDWEVHDLSKDRRSTSNVCIALTQSEANRTDYQLQLVKDKSRNSLLQVLIHQKGRGAGGWIIDLRSGQTLSFAKKGDVEKAEIFWNIPQNTAALIAQLNDRKDVRVRPADDTRDPRLEFSANGFSKAIEKMEEKCFGKESILNQKFEDAFVLRRDQIDPMRISQETVAALQGLQLQAFEVFRNSDAKDLELDRLNGKFNRELSEAASLQSTIERLGNYEIPNTIRNIQSNDNLESVKTAELARINSEIPGRLAARNAADSQLARARADLAPHLQEHEARRRSLDEVSRRQSMSSRRLQDAQSSVSQSRSRLAAMNNEVNRNQIENQRIQGELRNLDVNLRRADQAYRSFDSRRETINRLERDREYNQAQKELSAVEPNLRNIDRALRQADADVTLKEAALRTCKNRQATVTAYGDYVRLPAQDRPRRDGPSSDTRPGRDGNGQDRERPNRGGQDNDNTTPGSNTNSGSTTNPTPGSNTNTGTNTNTTPNPGPTAPSVDCSREESALAQSKGTQNDLRAQQRTNQDRRDNLMARIERARRDVERDVEREQRELSARVIELQRTISRLQGEFAQNENRNRSILASELPSEERNLRSYEAELQNAQGQLAADTNEVNRQSADLRNYESRVGWHQKHQAIQSAESNLSQRSSELANAESVKRSTEVIISQCQSSRVRLASDLNNLNQQKLNAESRLQKVRISLEPYEVEKSRIVAEGSVFKDELMRLAQDFESRI